MSPEEKIEAAQKLIDEARAEIAAKKRNWPEKIEPVMLFQVGECTYIVAGIENQALVRLKGGEDPVGKYYVSPTRETAPFDGDEGRFTCLGHARDLIKIADDAHEPTGAELVGRYCEYCDTDGDWDNWEEGVCEDFTPGADQPYLRNQDVRFRFARLAR